MHFRANTERKNIYHFCSVSVQIWNYVSDPPMDTKELILVSTGIGVARVTST